MIFMPMPLSSSSTWHKLPSKKIVYATVPVTQKSGQGGTVSVFTAVATSLSCVMVAARMANAKSIRELYQNPPLHVTSHLATILSQRIFQNSLLRPSKRICYNIHDLGRKEGILLRRGICPRVSGEKKFSPLSFIRSCHGGSKKDIKRIC